MGSNTTNSYFYKPSLGASGAVELALFDAKLDIADAAIKANLDGLAAKQPLDTGLTSIAALTTAANKMIYTTALDTYAVASLTAFARTILDDANASAVRTTIGAIASGANSDITSLTGLTTPLGAAYGGTGVANNAASTITISGNYATTLTVTEATGVTLPASGTLINSTDTAAKATILATARNIGGVSFDGSAAIVPNIVTDTTPELGGELDCGAHSVGFTIQTLTGSTPDDIDWKLGNYMKFTHGAEATQTFTFTAPSNPCALTLQIKQDGVGGRDITLPAAVKWLATEPTWSDGGANKTIIMSMRYDGTNYWSQATSWEA